MFSGTPGQIIILLELRFNKTIDIEKVYEKNLPMIICEGSKIQQVLFNMVFDAPGIVFVIHLFCNTC